MTRARRLARASRRRVPVVAISVRVGESLPVVGGRWTCGSARELAGPTACVTLSARSSIVAAWASTGRFSGVGHLPVLTVHPVPVPADFALRRRWERQSPSSTGDNPPLLRAANMYVCATAPPSNSTVCRR